MVGDMIEETLLLTEVAKNDACTGNKNKNTIEKKVNPCYVDNIQMDVLNNTIDNKIEKKDDSLNKTVGEKIEKSMEKCKCENDDEEYEKEYESDDKKSSNIEGENQHYHEERDFYEMSSSEEGSVLSDFDDWFKKKIVRHKVKHKSYLDY